MSDSISTHVGLSTDIYEAVLQHLSPSTLFTLLTTNHTLATEAQRCLYTYINLPLNSRHDLAHELERMRHRERLQYMGFHEKRAYEEKHSDPLKGPPHTRTEKLLDLLASNEGREKGQLTQSLHIGMGFPVELLPKLATAIQSLPNLRSLAVFDSNISTSAFYRYIEGISAPANRPKLRRLLCEDPISNDFLHLLALFGTSLTELHWLTVRDNPRALLHPEPPSPDRLPEIRILSVSSAALHSLHHLLTSAVEALQCYTPPFMIEAFRLNVNGGGDMPGLRALSIKNYLDLDVLLQIPLYYRGLRYLQFPTDSLEVSKYLMTLL